jgi:hypothetical protein
VQCSAVQCSAIRGQYGGKLWVRIAIFIYPLFTWLVWYWVLGIGLGIGFWAGYIYNIPVTHYTPVIHLIQVYPIPNIYTGYKGSGLNTKYPTPQELEG